MTKFNNYLEQVNSSVTGMTVYTSYPEVSKYFKRYLPKNILKNVDNVSQWFVVTIYEENENTQKLGIFYDEFLQLYILPVIFWGTSWEMVKPVNMLENEETE